MGFGQEPGVFHNLALWFNPQAHPQQHHLVTFREWVQRVHWQKLSVLS